MFHSHATSPELMRARTNAQLPKMTIIEGQLIRGDVRPVSARFRPNPLHNLIARFTRKPRAVQPHVNAQPRLSRS